MDHTWQVKAQEIYFMASCKPQGVIGPVTIHVVQEKKMKKEMYLIPEEQFFYVKLEEFGTWSFIIDYSNDNILDIHRWPYLKPLSLESYKILV